MRILLACQPIAGHLLPLREIARELLRRGHDLRWYTGQKYRQKVEDVGAVWEGFVHAQDYDDSDFDAAFPGRSDLCGLSQLLFDLRHVFVGQIEGQWYDLRDIERRWQPDIVVADQTVSAALLREELGGPPVALLGVLPLGIPSRDTAPFGLGLAPLAGWPGRLRNAALTQLTQRVVFRSISAQIAELSRHLGVQPRPFAPPIAPSLMLQPSIPELEYRRSDLPPQLHFIGPLLPASGDWTPPPWWDDVLGAKQPVVLVTQGTLATRPEQLLLPTARALANEPLLVVLAGVAPEDLGPLPDNARAARYIPFDQLLPHTSVYVTNGGYGGTLQALTHGLPCVVAGRSEDKAEVAARVAHSGAGVNLGTATPTPHRLQSAVRQVLYRPQFRAAANRLGHELRSHHAVTEAADLIEGVLREQHAPR